jgi:phage-related protein
MPKSINATAKIKAQAAKNNPIFLVTIALTGTTVRLTDNNADVTFPTSGGSVYTAWGMSFSPVHNTMTGEIDRVTVNLDNTDKSISSYIVNYDFPGRVLSIKRVFGDLLSSSSYATTVFSGIMGAPVAGENEATITAINPLIKAQQQGGRLYQNLCAWEFKGTECAYAGGSSTCNKTAAQCKSYGNMDNFGGFNYIPFVPVN